MEVWIMTDAYYIPDDQNGLQRPLASWWFPVRYQLQNEAACLEYLASTGRLLVIFL
jgi:hypothetical protein